MRGISQPDVVVQTLRIYEAQADTYLRQWGRRHYRAPRLLRACLSHLSPCARILDLGCGPGQDLRFLRRTGYRVVGMDGCRPFLRFARGCSPRAALVQADLRALPFRRETFAAVWAAASLIHLPKPAARRVLRALLALVPLGGLLAATFAHGCADGVRLDGWIPGRYFSRWQKVPLTRAIEQAGWTVLSLQIVANRERKGRWLNVLARR
ncbi:class I SAM-dependent methyltransferase [Nitrospira sp. Kam-Ns4a]